jgi:antitoxin component of MazEF toxin-antitoxin module
MSKRITTREDASLPLSLETLEAIGINAGDDLDIQIVGRALFVRSVEEAERSRDLAKVFESVLERRRPAYEELAKGPE